MLPLLFLYFLGILLAVFARKKTDEYHLNH
jgi:Sec-independent protein secretion pathway component TatC